MRTRGAADAYTEASRGVGLVVVAVFLLAGPGCYSYRPVLGVEDLAPGARVRPDLTRQGEVAFETRTRRRGGEIEGDVVRTDADTLYLAVGMPAVAMQSRGLAGGIDTVGIALDEINGIQQKKMDARRTTIVGATGVIGLGAYLLWRFSGSGGSVPRGGQDGSDDAFRSRKFPGPPW